MKTGELRNEEENTGYTLGCTFTSKYPESLRIIAWDSIYIRRAQLIIQSRPTLSKPRWNPLNHRSSVKEPFTYACLTHQPKPQTLNLNELQHLPSERFLQYISRLPYWALFKYRFLLKCITKGQSLIQERSVFLTRSRCWENRTTYFPLILLYFIEERTWSKKASQVQSGASLEYR